MSLKDKKIFQKQERIDLKGILAEFRQAVEEEKQEIEKSSQSSTLLYAGRQINGPGSEFWYRFQVEYSPVIPADTPCKLVIGKEEFHVTVISYEENAIVLSSKVLLPDTLGNVRLENSTTVLLERLIQCIEDNAETENAFEKKLFSLDENKTVYTSCKIYPCEDIAFDSQNTNTDNQKRAIIEALTNDITYIWGPPGTGKTSVIGQIVDKLYEKGRSTLIVSHTNTAVDGVIKKADEEYSKISQNDGTEYPILRIGKTTNLPERVFLETHVANLGRELYEKENDLNSREKKLKEQLNNILIILAKDTWLQKNNLKQIHEILIQIAEYEEQIKTLEKEISDIDIRMQQEKDAHPEYKGYLVLSKSLKEKKEEYDTLCSQTDKAENMIREYEFRFQVALDEIRKHDKYKELREQEARCMSVQFMQSELEKSRNQIDLLRSEIILLKEKQKNAETVISDYERKNSVVRFFTGKNTVNQAQNSLIEIQSQLPQVEEKLENYKKLEQEYQQQLTNLFVLQKQIQAVIPTETKQHWEETANQLKEDIKNKEVEFSESLAKKEFLHEELTVLEEKINQAKKPFDSISALGRIQKQAKDKLNKTIKALDEAYTGCTEMLEKEYALCESFYCSSNKKSSQALLEELSEMLLLVKKELEAVDIEQYQNEKAQTESELKEIAQQLIDIQQKIQELEKQAILNARIVGATLTQTYINTALRARKFDTVIIDEASMASIPALWCASLLAENSMIIVGDFLQLPPIVMAQEREEGGEKKNKIAKKWLGKDIFYHSGMQKKAKDKNNCPHNFVMLNDQFRMESDIADLANLYYTPYGGLRSNDLAKKRVEQREEFYAWYPGEKTENNVHLIATENLHAWVTGVPQGKNHSRMNCFSAAVVVEFAFKLLEKKLACSTSDVPQEKPSILIIAPYKPHIVYIDKLIKLGYQNHGLPDDLNYIRAGTIHSFQGNEADIVIFDLVIDEPHWKANLFVNNNEEMNDNLKKMFNVAVTRARFKLFVVGNFAYCQKRAKNNALSELLDKLLVEKNLTKTDAKTILPDIVFSKQMNFAETNFSGRNFVCQEAVFQEHFMRDVQSFKKRLIIYSPFMTENRLSQLATAFADAISVGKEIIVVTKTMSERTKTEVSRYQKCEKQLRDRGVRIIHKKGMHEKLVFVDSKAVWTGSLNVLSFTGLTGEVMQRQESSEIVDVYEKLYDIKHIHEVSENPYQQVCPICRNEMVVKESPTGGIYWECVTGDYSRSAKQRHPVDGILRCECGAPYMFSMKKEPRWVCSENEKHYQKMRESDLKLEKMVALIPTKAARKEVERYFDQKRKEREAKKQADLKENQKQISDNTNIDETSQLELFS